MSAAVCVSRPAVAGGARVTEIRRAEPSLLVADEHALAAPAPVATLAAAGSAAGTRARPASLGTPYRVGERPVLGTQHQAGIRTAQRTRRRPDHVADHGTRLEDRQAGRTLTPLLWAYRAGSGRWPSASGSTQIVTASDSGLPPWTDSSAGTRSARE